jgi:hypothetical protein
MKTVIERPCDMPIEIETINAGKYVIKLTVAGEVDYLNLEDAISLFRALFIAIGEVDDKLDRKEIKRA